LEEVEIKKEEAHCLTMQSPTLLQTENKKDSKLTPSTKGKARVVMDPDLKVRLMTVF
jgi:hypothetical protein